MAVSAQRSKEAKTAFVNRCSAHHERAVAVQKDVAGQKLRWAAVDDPIFLESELFAPAPPRMPGQTVTPFTHTQKDLECAVKLITRRKKAM